jgi:hypothetical protein
MCLCLCVCVCVCVCVCRRHSWTHLNRAQGLGFQMFSTVSYFPVRAHERTIISNHLNRLGLRLSMLVLLSSALASLWSDGLMWMIRSQVIDKRMLVKIATGMAGGMGTVITFLITIGVHGEVAEENDGGGALAGGAGPGAADHGDL